MGQEMFAAVLTATLFLLTAPTDGSAADSCTASLPPLVGGGGECSASEGGGLVNEINQNISTLLPEVVHCMLPGCTPDHPANSCAELAEQEPDIPSGNYWILNSTQSPVQVFCEMGEVFPSSLNVTGGWVRVANLNMTDPNQQCPENLQLSYTNQPIRLCGKSTANSCDSVIFTTYGVQYQQVCGRVRGYKFASPNAFEWIFGSCPAPCDDIDDPYVDGVSMEPVQGNTSGHMQLGYLKTTHTIQQAPVHALVVEDLLLNLWALTTTVSQELALLHGNLLFFILKTHCGMDKIVVDLSEHVVIFQTFRGSARSFLSQLLTTWSFASVAIIL